MNTTADEVVTFFEVWMLRNISRTGYITDTQNAIRNKAEDMIFDDVEYWSNTSMTKLYEQVCGALNLKPYCHD
jgi:hypothetical protein